MLVPEWCSSPRARHQTIAHFLCVLSVAFQFLLK